MQNNEDSGLLKRNSSSTSRTPHKKTPIVRAKKDIQAPPRSKSTRTGIPSGGQNQATYKTKVPSPTRTGPPHEPYQSSSSHKLTPSDTGLMPLNTSVMFLARVIIRVLSRKHKLDKIPIITRVKRLTLGEYKLQHLLAETFKTRLNARN